MDLAKYTTPIKRFMKAAGSAIKWMAPGSLLMTKGQNEPGFGKKTSMSAMAMLQTQAQYLLLQG